MALLAIVGFVALMIVSTLLNGWALSVLWGWFFVPTLGLPDLTVVQAIGIGMVVSYLTHQYTDTDSKNEEWWEGIVRAFSFAIFKPIFAISFGWVIHLFM